MASVIIPDNIIPDEITPEMIEAIKAKLPETDGEPLDTPWHRDQINMLIDIVKQHYRGRTDFYAGGNMFIYFPKPQVKTWEYKGPDFFLVKGVDGTIQRRFWWVLDEHNRYPDLIIELLSPSTAKIDRTTKKAIYEQRFRTPEYYCYDPDAQRLEGWRLSGVGKYEAILPNEKGWMWSEQLQLWLGTWEGAYLRTPATWLRWFDSQKRVVPTEAEAAHQGAEAAHQRAEAESQRAEAEHQQVETLEAEVTRLQKLLADQGLSS